MYQYTNTDGTPVPRWVNDKLNTFIEEQHAEIYDRCIHGLDILFRDFNKSTCAQCNVKSWTSEYESKGHYDCGCCIGCADANGFVITLKATEEKMLAGVPFDTNPVYKHIRCPEDSYFDGRYEGKINMGWGYFDPSTHSCSLPRHLRSVICIRHHCFSPTAEFHKRVCILVDAVSAIRFDWDDRSARILSEAEEILKEMGIHQDNKGE